MNVMVMRQPTREIINVLKNKNIKRETFLLNFDFGITLICEVSVKLPGTAVQNNNNIIDMMIN